MDNQEERRMLARAVAAATYALQRHDGTIMLDHPHYAVVVSDPATGRSWGYRRVKDLVGRLESLDGLEAQVSELTALVDIEREAGKIARDKAVAQHQQVKAVRAAVYRLYDAAFQACEACGRCQGLSMVWAGFDRMADIAASGVRNGPDA